jgi:hypothetical protein
MFIEEPDVGNLQVRFCEGRSVSLTIDLLYWKEIL